MTRRCTVWRDGTPHDWAEHGKHLYCPVGDEVAVIEQGWNSSTLTGRTGNSVFAATVSAADMETFNGE